MRRRGLSLIELVMAGAVIAIVAGTLVGLSNTVEQSWRYTQQSGATTQHARVVLERINRLVSEALSAPGIPGVAVMYEDVSTWRFYDTLVVWHAGGMPQNPDGPPLVGECVFICPDPNDPTQLVEITAPGDTREMNIDNKFINQSVARAVIESVKTSPTSQKVVLTDLLRAPEVTSAAGRRGAIHMVSGMLPMDSELSQYDAGTVAWSDLSWPQDAYGSQTGTRQYWLRVELQLMPSRDDALNELGPTKVRGFFGSASHYFRLDRGST